LKCGASNTWDAESTLGRQASRQGKRTAVGGFICSAQQRSNSRQKACPDHSNLCVFSKLRLRGGFQLQWWANNSSPFPFHSVVSTKDKPLTSGCNQHITARQHVSPCKPPNVLTIAEVVPGTTDCTAGTGRDSATWPCKTCRDVLCKKRGVEWPKAPNGAATLTAA